MVRTSYSSLLTYEGSLGLKLGEEAFLGNAAGPASLEGDLHKAIQGGSYFRCQVIDVGCEQLHLCVSVWRV